MAPAAQPDNATLEADAEETTPTAAGAAPANAWNLESMNFNAWDLPELELRERATALQTNGAAAPRSERELRMLIAASAGRHDDLPSTRATWNPQLQPGNIAIAAAWTIPQLKPVRNRTCSICNYLDGNALAAGVAVQLQKRSADADVLILSIGDLARYNVGGAYHTNWLAWTCYANRWGAAVRIVDPGDVPDCPQYKDWFFRRVCTVKLIVKGLLGNGADMQKELQLAHLPKWIFTVDGDTIPLNGNMAVSHFTDQAGDKDVLFIERFRNGEIAAGTIMFRTNSYSAKFLEGWESLEATAASVPFSNSDNGALHLHLVSELRDEIQFPVSTYKSADQLIKWLRHQYALSGDIPTYDRFVASAKLALGPKRVFKHIQIYRRGNGFCEDDDMWSDGIKPSAQSRGPASRWICIHGAKNAKRDLVDKIGQTCVDSVSSCRASVFECGESVPADAARHLIEAVRSYPAHRMGAPFNDISDCYPNCSLDLDAHQWAALQPGLQKNAECSTPVWGCCCQSNSSAAFLEMMR